MPDQISHAVHSQRPIVLKPCGHDRHVGTCSTCQRVQLERWNAQLAQVRPAGLSIQR